MSSHPRIKSRSSVVGLLTLPVGAFIMISDTSTPLCNFNSEAAPDLTLTLGRAPVETLGVCLGRGQLCRSRGQSAPLADFTVVR